MTRVAVPVIFLLVVALVGMCSRSPEPEAAPAPAPSPAPTVVAYAPDYSAVLRRALPHAATPTPPEVAWPLSRQDAETVLRTAGWPEGWIPEALLVACGPAWNVIDDIPAPTGESNCDPAQIGDGGRSLGLFQIQPRFWSDRCGAGEAELRLPLPNAACALIIVRDNIAAGRDRWEFWSVRP